MSVLRWLLIRPIAWIDVRLDALRSAYAHERLMLECRRRYRYGYVVDQYGHKHPATKEAPGRPVEWE